MPTTIDREKLDQQLARRYSQQRPTIERRGEGDDESRVIVGYAAVFYRAGDAGTEFRMWEDTVERIMPGAFDAALREKDIVRGLTNHDSNWLIGRSDKGTLRLSVDAIGLRYEIDAPDTQAGRDTVALLARGDLDGSSFTFRTSGRRGNVKWSEETRDGQTLYVRELHDLELYDVGPVTFPAYAGTAAGVRAGDGDLRELRAEFDRWRQQRSAEGVDDRCLAIDLDYTIAAAEELMWPAE